MDFGVSALTVSTFRLSTIQDGDLDFKGFGPLGFTFGSQHSGTCL